MNTKKMLENLIAQRREKRAKSLGLLPGIYKSQIEKILSATVDLKADSKKVEQNKVLVKSLKEELEKNNIANGYSKEIFSCLDEIDKRMTDQELMYYKQGVLINTFFSRMGFLLTHPQLFEIRTILKRMDYTSKYLVEPISKLSLEQLKKLYEFSKEDEETEKLIKETIRECINGFSEELGINYSENIDETQKEEIIAIAQENFPNIGNNKLLFFSRPNQVKYLDHEFKKHMYTVFQDFYKDYISYNMDKYKNISNLFQDVFISISIATKDGSLDEMYLAYAQEYINDFFTKTLDKKNNNKTNTKNSNLADFQRINQSLQEHMPKKSIKPEVLEGIDRLLSEIGTNKDTENEIRRIFLKRFLKKTEIRLYDLQEKYGIQKELISESTIKILVNAGCNINTNGAKEKAKTEISPNKAEFISNTEETTTENQDKIIEEVRNRADIHEIFEYYGYTIVNPKRFEKQITSLYPSQKEKEILIDTLKSNIEKPRKRNGLGYRAIDLKIGRRILILNKNEIDGIYTHEEYVNRTSVII